MIRLFYYGQRGLLMEMTVAVLGRSILCDCLETAMMPSSSTVLCRLGERYLR